jgi:hypothetical protein
VGAPSRFHVFHGGAIKSQCENCGTYYTSGEFITDYNSLGRSDKDAAAHVSAWIRDKWRRREENIVVTQQDVDAVLKMALLVPEGGIQLDVFDCVRVVAIRKRFIPPVLPPGCKRRVVGFLRIPPRASVPSDGITIKNHSKRCGRAGGRS